MEDLIQKPIVSKNLENLENSCLLSMGDLYLQIYPALSRTIPRLSLPIVLERAGRAGKAWFFKRKLDQLQKSSFRLKNLAFPAFLASTKGSSGSSVWVGPVALELYTWSKVVGETIEEMSVAGLFQIKCSGAWITGVWSWNSHALFE